MPTLRAGNVDIVISEVLFHLFMEWEDLARNVIGPPGIPVEVRSRYEFPKYSQFKGELNIAEPKMRRDDDGRVVLTVIVESLAPLNEVIVAHEIMHWILKLRGFPSLQNKDDPNDDITILLNSLIAHMPLNRLMTEHGFDYLSMEDSRTNHAIQSMREELPRSPSEKRITWLALHFADMILNSSPSVGEQLKQILGMRPTISSRVQKVLSTLEYYDLNNPEESRKAARRLVKALRLGRWGTFVEADDIGALKQALKTLSAT